MSEKILVVDDQLYMMRLIEHHLAKAGYELIKARTSAEARVALATEKPTLMVGDTKDLEAGSNIRAIRVTDDLPTPGENGASGAEFVFHKPFSPTQLVAKVKKLMDSPSPERVSL